MAAGTTEVADIVVPEIFNPYTQQITEEKSRIIASGAMVRDESLSALLNGGGITFNDPSFQDLDNDVDNVSSDTGADATVVKIATGTEVQVRLSRNQHWASADLAGDLAGEDPLTAIGNRVGAYWARRLQAATIATMVGLFADNDAAPGGTEHVQFDLTNDISGGGYVAGVTDFSAEAAIDTAVLMGDSMQDLGMIFVHSIVYSRMQKNNLIDFIPDARGEVDIPFFQGKLIVIDDGMPNPAGAGVAATAAGIYHSWILGAGALRWGSGNAKVPTEVERSALANVGGGEETLTNRVEWCIHPAGHAYQGTAANGGPSNLGTANNLAHLDSWIRIFPERKQIKITRLISRES